MIFSNYGSGASGAYAVYGTNTIGGLDTASAFTPSATATFDSFTISADFFGGTPAFILELAADSGGLPGAVLEEYSISLPAPSGLSSPTTVLSTVHTALFAGTQYWAVLAADPGNPDGKGEWYANPLGTSGGAQYESGSWSLSGGIAGPLLEVDGSTAPEPSTVAMLGMGMAGLFWVRKHRRNA